MDDALAEPMKEKPKRRWRRFSIRTLLVAVTIVCLWLGWQVNTVWQRRGLLDLVSERGGAYLFVADSNPFEAADRAPLDLSYMQNKLGDQLVRWIEVPDDFPERDRQRIRRAFPEAELRVSANPKWPHESSQ
jgi:hypothetical protein